MFRWYKELRSRLRPQKANEGSLPPWSDDRTFTTCFRRLLRHWNWISILIPLLMAFRRASVLPDVSSVSPHTSDFAVVVDYAHTDDALLNTLKTARDLTSGRIITVFGCGGDRDKTKRRPMGDAQEKTAIVASSRQTIPATEDPLRIIDEIEAGVKETDCGYSILSDRREAIYRAVAMARPGDVVIIAGKGHETYQIVGNEKFHFDDREVARRSSRKKS